MAIDMMSSTPDQVAAQLFEQSNRNVQSAEKKAWSAWERAAGGTYFNRPNVETYEAVFMAAVIKTIIAMHHGPAELH